MKLSRWQILALCSWVLLSAAAQAAEAPFYRGKNVTFLINFAAGGPTDIEGRIVARHWPSIFPAIPW
jgi:putative tricarboxylic transport membrane protein